MKHLIYSLSLITMLLFLSSEMHTANAQNNKFEAEDAALTGTSVATSRTGFSGTGYVTGFDNAADKIAFAVNVESEGFYTLNVTFASPYGYKEGGLSVNGVGPNKISINPTSGFTGFFEVNVGQYFLNEGNNSITIHNGWGYYEVDYIQLTPPAPNTPFDISNHPVNPNASPEANILYTFLKNNFGNKIISGQYATDTELDFIYNLTGKKPAIRGFDFMDYSPSRAAFGASSTETEKAIEWWNNGGIVTFCWHWNAPKDLINTEGKEWWRGFYSDATTFDLSIAQNDPLSEEYQLIIRDLDAIAVQLKKLKDANVPILWRPLHEAAGNGSNTWFWWGDKGSETCMWLYDLMYDRLTNHHQLNNLIWIWTTHDVPTALDWYPGGDKVDILGADIYLEGGNHSASTNTFNGIRERFDAKKMIALTENGAMPDPEYLTNEEAWWSWFCNWYGKYITDPTINSQQIIQKVYTSDYVITLDELPDFTSISTSIENDNLNNGILVYPNPVSGGLLNVETALTNQTVSGKISIYNSKGSLVYSGWINKRLETIDMQNLKTGVYIVKIHDGKIVRTFKLVKT